MNKISRKLLAGLLTLVMILSLIPMFAIAEEVGLQNVPAMPLNVEYSPITTESVTIRWNPVAGADGYNIYRRDAKAGDSELIGTIASVGFIDQDVEAGAEYWYCVSAFNAGGESVKTEEAFIMVATEGDGILLSSFQLGFTGTDGVFRPIRGSRLRLGDLTGDGRTDILVCNTSQQSNFTTNGSVHYLLAAFDIEGNYLWHYTLDPAWNINAPDSGIGNSSSDEPVNIADVDGDGFNDVVALMHPQKNRAANYTGGVIVVLDGRTGQVKKDAFGNDCSRPVAQLTGTGLSNVNVLGDCFNFGNFDGREIDNQFIVLKARYADVTIFEMFNQEGRFVMNFVWRHTARASGQGSSGNTMAGHMPLVVDLDGDGISDLVSNYSVFKVLTDANGNVIRNAAGQPTVVHWWWINAGSNAGVGLVKRSGSTDQRLPGWDKNDNTPMRYPGTTRQIQATDHVDTIQVGYVLGKDGPLCVVFGGGGPDGQGSSTDMTRTSTFCYTWDGEFVWVSNSAIEPQSLNLGEFRTDAPGLTVWGLDRRTRGAASNSGWGRDSLFMIGTHGEALFLEYGWNSGNPMGWSTIVIRVDNWTGTYAPMCLAFNRNSESRAGARDFGYPAGQNTGTANRPLRKQLWMNDYREPALYDGYANSLFKLSVPMNDREYMFDNNVDWRFMAMDLCGDARTELVGYDDSGRIRIYYNNANGDVRINEDGSLNEQDRIAVLRSGITGEPKPQTYFMSNYTRYPTDVYFDNIEKRIPAQAQASAVGTHSANITWTPVITATSYTLYRDGVAIAENVKNIGFFDIGLSPSTEYKYTVVAYDGERFSPPSLPLAITTGIFFGDLEDFVEEVEELEAADYTAISWAALLMAFDNAKAVLEDNDATQEEIDDALAALKAAFEALVIVRELNGFIFDLLKEDLNWADFTTASWAALMDALDAAAMLLDDEYDATQEEIDDALEALVDALANLGLKQLIKSVPTARVRVFSGNTNELFITVTEHFCNGTINTIEAAIFIRNNAEGSYKVGSYTVFVDTKGNDQIRAIRIV